MSGTVLTVVCVQGPQQGRGGWLGGPHLGRLLLAGLLRHWEGVPQSPAGSSQQEVRPPLQGVSLLEILLAAALEEGSVSLGVSLQWNSLISVFQLKSLSYQREDRQCAAHPPVPVLSVPRGQSDLHGPASVLYLQLLPVLGLQLSSPAPLPAWGPGFPPLPLRHLMTRNCSHSILIQPFSLKFSLSD